MIRLKISVDDADTQAQLRGLSIEAYTAAWAEAVRKLAEGKALKLGSRVGPRVADAITVKPDRFKPEILLDGPDSKMAAHIHEGGPIRSGNGKILAIPTKWNERKEDFASTWPKESLFFLRSRKRNKAYLFKTPGPGEKLGHPMFFLTPKTKPQKPRPWWPEDAEIEAATVRFFDDNF